MSDTMSEDWFGTDTATFGDRLAAAREQAGLSQAELAKRLGVQEDTVKEWEQDISEPRANRLSMMAGILNVSIMWLLNAEGEGVISPDEAESHPGVGDILAEIRDLKTQIDHSSERLSRLEATLRARFLQ